MANLAPRINFLSQPKFWRNRGVIALLLLPFSFLYRLFLLLQTKPNILDLGIPIICVGNINVGGAGKTPTAIKIAQLLMESGKKIAFVSKGYGGDFKHTTKIILEKHQAREVGDEALLLAEIADCYVCKNRVDGCKTAKYNGAEIIILDDGFHDSSIKKSLNIMVVDGVYGFGNGFLMPSGPLRCDLQQAIVNADIILIIGEDKCAISGVIGNKKPISKAQIIPDFTKLDKQNKYHAFAAIAHPDKFYNSLELGGYNVVATKSFADHWQYRDSDIELLIMDAEKQNAQLITTKKDFVKIANKYHDKVEYLPIELNFLDKNLHNMIQ